jgi:thiosulfate/3-mercaptopyruvate sulfurtransferase
MSEPVVAAAWVDAHREDLRLLDVRDAWEYDGLGHLPGAVNVPFDSFRAEEHAAAGDGGAAGEQRGAVGGSASEEAGAVPGEEDGAEVAAGSDGRRGMLPAPDDFATLMGSAGVTRGDDVVAYDDHHGVFAARLLVTLELFGHPPDRLHLLDGDFSAWRLEFETAAEAPAVDPATYEVRDPIDSPLVAADEIAAAVDDPAVVIVDTREEWEFEEGHIPGAVRLDWRELVDDETRGLKARGPMLDLLADRGIVPSKRVILYCNTARRISHTYTVLRHLGYEDLGFYEGSLTEWEAAGRPVETA